MELRPYQTAAIDAAMRAFERHRRILVVMATGLGKTVAFSGLAARFAAQGKRTLVLAHREELVRQAAATIARATGLTVDVEMAQESSCTLLRSDVVVGTVQSMNEARCRRFGPNDFGLIVLDEAHHSCAKSWRKVLNYFEHALVYGTTATPDRGDKIGLGNIYEKCVFKYSILAGIQDGWLVPLRQRTVHCSGLDLSSVRVTAGDLNAGDLEKLLSRDEVLHQIASPLVELVEQRPTLVFTPGVRDAHQLAECLRGYGRTAVALDGGTDKVARAQQVQAFKSGEIQCLVNCGLFTEGFDSPRVSCVAIARPTKSTALYAQMIGRGIRTEDGSRLQPHHAKQDALILDFVGNAGRHSLASVQEVLAGRVLPPDEEELVVNRMATGMAVHEAMESAQRELQQRAALPALTVKAKYQVQDVDPFAVGRRERVELERARLEQGLCAVAQAQFLQRHGLPTDVTFRQASEWIAAIRENGGQLPKRLTRRRR